jgi:hypothetical protein
MRQNCQVATPNVLNCKRGAKWLRRRPDSGKWAFKRKTASLEGDSKRRCVAETHGQFAE